MGNVKFLVKLTKLTVDVQERLAAIDIAKSVGGITHGATEASKRLLRRVAGGKPTLFDEVERMDAEEVTLMREYVNNHNGQTGLVKNLLSRVDDEEASAAEQSVSLVAPEESAIPLFAGVEGGIQPVKDATRANRIRRLLLPLPKKAVVKLGELMSVTGLSNSEIHPVIQQLRWDKILRRKRNINGGFMRGVYTKTAGANAIIRRCLKKKYGK
jgi:hypothetical protein